jgi:hypothetical protein
MSIPECERYRNSTMFVGSPPFGYEGTDDRTDTDPSSWHPPRVPPHDMVYREHICPHVGPCPEAYIGRQSRAKSPSPEAEIPEMDLVDVVPALYSSPKLNPHLAEHGGHFPDISQLSIHDNKQSRGPHNRGFNTLAGMLKETPKNGGSISLKIHTSAVPTNTQETQTMRWATASSS